MQNQKTNPRQPAASPQLTAPDRRPIVGGLYSARLLFEFSVYASGELGARRLCEERLILVEAPSALEALRETKRQGRASQYRYRNAYGSPVHFRFVGVLDLCHLGVECEPNEVWYAIGKRLRPMERRGSIIPKAHDLSAVQNEITRAGRQKRRERKRKR